MGSQDSELVLPQWDSDDLILTHPTPTERRRTWALTHASWGAALSPEDYLAREAYLSTVPGASDGRLESWILTTKSASPDARPVLSSVDTLRKRAVACDPGSSSLKDGAAFGIGSVFTDPQFRGNRYASRMLRDLGLALKKKRDGGQKTLFSVLYSDIGKSFYARHGWPPYESTHVSWIPAATATTAEPSVNGSGGSGIQVTPLTAEDLPELCAVDEELLRSHLPGVADTAGRPAVALLPDLDTMLWHLKREEFMCEHIFPDRRTPTIRGAIVGPPGKRVWAIWTRGYYGGLKKPEDNTLHILRVVVEDGLDTPGPSDEQVAGFTAIVELARREAAAWQAAEVQLWNPMGPVKALVDRCDVPGGKLVVREEDSITSLMWYGNEVEVEWAANDKFGWC